MSRYTDLLPLEQPLPDMLTIFGRRLRTFVTVSVVSFGALILLLPLFLIGSSSHVSNTVYAAVSVIFAVLFLEIFKRSRTETKARRRTQWFDFKVLNGRLEINANLPIGPTLIVAGIIALATALPVFSHLVNSLLTG